MEEEKKDEGLRNPIKLFLDQALEKQRNAMMDNFAQILQRLPTYITYASSTSANRSTTSWTNPILSSVEFSPREGT